jgi:hypothetical protein
MTITYRELKKELDSLSDEQLDMDLTVELSYEDECIPAEFRITGETHGLLDPDHPVIFVR